MTLTTEPEPSARIDIHHGWGELILSRPARKNALIGPMVAELRAGLAELLANNARVIVLRGDGGVFCSGIDVDAFAAKPAWQATWAHDWANFHRELYKCPAVIVGALERYAINGGASPALACDLLVAGRGAYLMVGEAAIGMHAPMNVAWLRLRTTEAVAAQLALAAGRVSAEDLWRLGLVYKVVADEAVLAEAQKLATHLAGFPGQGLAAIKAGLRRTIASDEDVFAAVVRGGPETSGPARAPR